MVLSGFGHRLDELGGYDIDTLAKLVCFAVETLEKFEATKVVSGMGLGWEQALALAAIELDLPLIAAIPFEGQQKVWPEKSQVFYRSLLDKATKVKIVSSGSFTGMKFVERDKWIIDNSDGVLMLWRNWKVNESESPEDLAVVSMGDQDQLITVTKVRNTNSILRRTLEYAEDKDRRIFQLWPFWDSFKSEVDYDVFRESMMDLSLE